MNAVDVIAERFRMLDSLPLSDFVRVALPVYSVQADVLLIEKRSLLPSEEYVLRAVVEGVDDPAQVGEFLGLLQIYSARLIQNLVNEDYLGMSDSGRLFVQPRGRQALVDDGEEVLREKSMPILWDPIAQCVLTSRVQLIPPRQVSAPGRLKVAPKSTKLPPPAHIATVELQAIRTGMGEGADSEVLKCIELRRPYLRYRDGLVLAYAADRSSPPVIRVAVDGSLDATYSDLFGLNATSDVLGADKGFHRRSGVQAIEQRVRVLPSPASGEASFGELLRRRSSLRLSIESLEKKRTPDAADESKLDARRSELDGVEAELAKFPQRPLMPYECGQLLRQYVSSARESLVITSTLPAGEKFDELLLFLLQQAAERGVSITIYAVGRPPADFLRSTDERWKPLRRFSELASQFDNFRIRFLRDANRVVFECVCDGRSMFIANEPSLGIRSSPVLLRQFAGSVLSGAEVVERYSAEFLEGLEADVEENFRFARAPTRRERRSSSAASPRGRN